MAVTPRKLSASTNGRGILLGTGPTLLHTSVTGTGASVFDEVYIWVASFATLSRVVTFYLGTTGSSDRLIDTVSPRSGFYQMVPGLRLAGGSPIQASTTSPGGVVTAYGIVNRNA